MSTPTIADEIERYVRTGDADMDAWAWPGDLMERGRRQHADLRVAGSMVLKSGFALKPIVVRRFARPPPRSCSVSGRRSSRSFAGLVPARWPGSSAVTARTLRSMRSPPPAYPFSREAIGKGKQLATALGLSEPDHAEMRSEFKHRFLGLALEAYRRDEISHGKLRELVAMVGLSIDDLDQLLDDAGLDGEVDPTPRANLSSASS